ncbi:MAG: HAD-IB family hydrolase [bacterium]
MHRTDQHKLRIAVFDIDETLLLGTSAEIQLIRFLYKKKIITAGNLLKSLFNALLSIFQGIDKVIYRKSGYLKGVEKKIVLSQLPQLFDQYIWPRVSKKLINDIQAFKKKNYEIVIISGTLDFLLYPFIVKVHADGGVGSHMEIENGKFSGRITGVYPYRKGKIRALEQYLDGREVDYTHSYAFADSLADFPFLTLFGNSVAVNPGFLLWIRAKLSGWQTMKIKE